MLERPDFVASVGGRADEVFPFDVEFEGRGTAFVFVLFVSRSPSSLLLEGGGEGGEAARVDGGFAGGTKGSPG